MELGDFLWASILDMRITKPQKKIDLVLIIKTGILAELLLKKGW